jgi:hypothetical protein
VIDYLIVVLGPWKGLTGKHGDKHQCVDFSIAISDCQEVYMIQG